MVTFYKVGDSMLIGTTFALVLFCPVCGRMHIEEVSVFALRSGTKNIICFCGHHLACLHSLSKERYMLSFGEENDCAINTVCFSIDLLGTNKVYPFPGVELVSEGGFVGSLQAVYSEIAMAAGVNSMVVDNDFGAKVDAPEVMFEVINKVDDLAVAGSIYCGNCWRNDIGIEIFDSFILLYCNHCGNIYEIRAKYQEDVRYIRKVDFIELQPIREN